jgi:hypothetical protein
VEEDVIWAYLPKELITKFHNGVDPWEDEHYFYSPEELLDCIDRDVIRQEQEPKKKASR